MALSNENNPRILMLQIGDVTAGVAASLPGLQAIGPDQVKSITLINNAVLAGDDTNNVQVDLQRVGGASLGSYLNNVASGGLAARVGKKLTLVSAELSLADLDDLEVAVSHNGTGGALTGAVLMVELIA